MVDFDALVNGPLHAVFGQTVTWYSGAGIILPFTGIFAAKFTQTKFQDGTEISSTRSVVNVRSSLFPVPVSRGDIFAIQGVFYVVDEIDDDGLGDIRFYLVHASDADAARLPLPAR